MIDAADAIARFERATRACLDVLGGVSEGTWRLRPAGEAWLDEVRNTSGSRSMLVEAGMWVEPATGGERRQCSGAAQLASRVDEEYTGTAIG